MESYKVLVGDHTGMIKIVDSDIKAIGSPGKHKGILNIQQIEDVFWCIHEDGSIQEFDETGLFSSIRAPSEKIVDGCSVLNQPCVAYHNGNIDISGRTAVTQQTQCLGLSSYSNTLSLCGTSPIEVWDLATLQQKWKAWTLKPRDPVHDNKCHIKENLITTITANNEVVLFDMRSSKKPRKISQLNKPGSTFFYPLETLCVNEDLVFVGDSVGQVYKLDSDFKVLGKTKVRSCGAIMSIASKNDKLWSCGMDRRLMVHDVKTMNLIDKKYLWQKLRKVVVIE